VLKLVGRIIIASLTECIGVEVSRLVLRIIGASLTECIRVLKSDGVCEEVIGGVPHAPPKGHAPLQGINKRKNE
jgi:hypothetical protein